MGWNLYEIYSPSFRIVKTCFQTVGMKKFVCEKNLEGLKRVSGTLGIGMIQSLWVKLGA